MGKLEGKIALVTGGNSGIGLATANRFASKGAHVFITGRRDGELAAAVKEIGKNVTGVQGDVSKLGDLDRLFSQIKREKGTVQKALPLMPDGASIILNASIVASKGLADWSLYSATKAAVRSFARTWTTDLKARRIRVNAVSPGYIDTPAWRSIEAAERQIETLSKTVPLGRFGTADEIAKAVVFLASEDSSYVAGVELFVDGGFTQV